MNLAVRLLRAVARLALRFFYSELEVHGRELVPQAGPVIFIANHPNGMVDPAFILAGSPRAPRFVAKEPLFRIPVLGLMLRALRCVPVRRRQDPGYAAGANEQAFEAVKQAFAEGGAVAIFPEGTSHTDPALVPFKPGAAKMALEAESLAGFTLGIQAVPVGIHFERTRLFRGRALVTFGPPSPVAAHRAAFEADPKTGIDALTKEMQARLSRQVLDAENEELERLAGIVEQFGVMGTDDGLLAKFQRKKLILDEYARLKETKGAEVGEVRRLLRRYDRALRVLGAGDRHIAATYSWGSVAGYALRNAALLVLGLPFLALGLAVNFVPYWLVRGLASLAGREEDLRASVALLTSVFVYPLWYAGVAWFCGDRWDWRWWAPLLVLSAPAGILAVASLERWRKMGRETGLLSLALFRPAVRSRLKAWRKEILQKLAVLQDSP